MHSLHKIFIHVAEYNLLQEIKDIEFSSCQSQKTEEENYYMRTAFCMGKVPQWRRD